MVDPSDLSARTDDVARRIEYATGGKWTDDQYKKVCAMLRFYRYKSLNELMDRIAKDKGSEAGGPPHGA